MSDLITEADATGKLDCGCVISGSPRGRAQIAFCPTHRGAQAMRMNLNLLRGFTLGAPAVFKGNGPDARRARDRFETAHKIIDKVLSEIDPTCLGGCTVKQPKGPGAKGDSHGL